MRVLVACEFSGAVRDAFIARGHDAVSCDLLPSERPGPHHQGDVRDLLGDGWDLMVAFPPCTDLATSGGAHLATKRADGRVDAALGFVRDLLLAPIPRICVENPRSIITSAFRPPDQMINPWEHGHEYAKATMLWLVNLPPLQPTRIMAKRQRWVDLLPPGPERWRERSRTFPGVAAAMAEQWGRASLTVQAPLFELVG